MKQLFTWPTIELDAINARKTSVPAVTPSHITWVKCADKLTPKVADSVKKNSNNHRQVWSQHLEMSAEKENASTWCRNRVIKYWNVVIRVLDQLEKNSACHVLKMNALQKWMGKWNQMSTKMNSVRFATVQV